MITRKESSNKHEGLFKSMKIKKSDKNLIASLNKFSEIFDEKDIILKSEEDQIQAKYIIRKNEEDKIQPNNK